ncbi:peroxidase 1 [Canna indica]|uniref:Peroxidase n=1 Tax=Canna indica TaxID=4628 RepID=A0AAQ3L4M2_9LILI|nr:peroxidase 1 [Canna indica]
MMSSSSKSSLLALLALLLTFSTTDAHVELGFYNETCPNAEAIVLEEMKMILSADPTLAPSLLRMHFQDCFVRGCDGSILLNSSANNLAEKDAPPNKSLRGFDAIDRIKAKLEETCPGIVSCTDILTIAARDAVFLTDGPFYDVPTGRRDGNMSEAADLPGNLPPPTATIDELKASFLQRNLTVKDLVVLSGTYLRLYNFSGKGDADPSLDKGYAEKLKRKCMHYDMETTLVKMDLKSPMKFDLGYYKLVSMGRGLFTSDEALLHDPDAKAYVERQAVAASPEEFFGDFAASMVRMGKLGALTHQKGEIRKKCAFVN